MSLTLDWLHLVILLGAVQGVFLVAVLAARQQNRTANRCLAVLMFAFTVHLASTVYHAAGLVPVAPHLFGIAYPMPFLYGPLVYLYALAAADRTRGVRRTDALHFAPFVATVLAGLPIYMMSAAEKVALFNQFEGRTGEPPLVVVVADPLKFVSGITYAVLTIVFLRRHRERVKDSYSTTERVNLHWLLWFANAAAAIWALAVGIDLLRATGVVRLDVGDDLVSLAIAVLVYGVGYRGLHQPDIGIPFEIVRPGGFQAEEVDIHIAVADIQRRLIDIERAEGDRFGRAAGGKIAIGVRAYRGRLLREGARVGGDHPGQGRGNAEC